MYSVYIIKSLKHGRYYIGSTKDFSERLKRHNAGRNTSTKNGIPWQLIYKEEHRTLQSAYKRELQIKRYKGGKAFKKLIVKI